MNERLFLRLADDLLQGPESGVPSGSLRAVPVPAPLRLLVAHAMIYRETVDPAAPVRERVLPDGSLRLVVGFGEQPVAFAVGASIRPALITLSGRMHGLSLTLRPGAAQALFGVPAGALAEQAPALEALWRGEVHALIDELAGVPDEAACVRAVWRHLLARAVPPADAAAGRVAAITRLIGEAGGSLRSDALSRRTGLGERRLQQLFAAQLGLSPRAVGRLARMQAMVRRLRTQPEPDWAQLAAEGGFCDQSHLIHDFRELFDLTPTAYRALSISASSKTAAAPPASVVGPISSRSPR